jgi:hypothetical protein
MSSGNIISGLTWSRTTTTLSITSTAHGLTAGDYVVIRNMSVDYSYLTISNVTTNAFDVTVPDSGGTSGTDGVYIPALDVPTLGDATISVSAPSSGNVQIMSMTIFINLSQTDPKSITFPTSITNGAGGNSSLQTKNPPVFQAFNVNGGTSSQLTSASLLFSTSGTYGVMSLEGGIDNFGKLLMTFKF